MTVGSMVGNEESYEVAKELLDPIIEDHHGGYKLGDEHKTDLNPDNLLQQSGPLVRAELSGVHGPQPQHPQLLSPPTQSPHLPPTPALQPQGALCQ